jgi:hypothetical protein
MIEPMKYKTTGERTVPRKALESAYKLLRERLLIASKFPSAYNRRKCSLTEVAKDTGLNRTTLWHYTQMKTYE